MQLGILFFKKIILNYVSKLHINDESRSNKNIASIGQSFGELFNLCVSKELIIDDGDNRLQGEDGLSERDRRTLAGEIVLESMKTFYKSVNFI